MPSCTKCFVPLTTANTYVKPRGGLRSQCKPCHNNVIREGRFNVSIMELLAAQGMACALCGVDLGGKYHVDHDHRCCDSHKSCGVCVRGLICRGCNIGLGYFKDNPELLRTAARYIEAGFSAKVG